MTSPAEHRQQRSGLFRADAHDHDQVDTIDAGLEMLAAGQGADRVGVRLIRPLYWADGSKVTDGRGDQRRAILAGVFGRDRLRDAAALIAELNARAINDPRDSLGVSGAVGGWHAYVHAQRVSAPITNGLLPGALGTVRTEGVAGYSALVCDVDPTPGAEPGVAVGVAHDLAQVLVDAAGVPRGAIMLQQSGRGAYLLVAIEPQPLAARETIKRATRTLARLIEAAGEPARGDESVFDPPRIIRIPGTINHKADADPTTPAWVLEPWTPGVRTPWATVERIAAKSRPKLRPVPIAAAPRDRSTYPRQPLRDLFTDRGWLYRERADGVCDVRCPNADQHTDGRDAAILYPPREPGGPGWLKCSHAHCAALDLFTVYRLLERA